MLPNTTKRPTTIARKESNNANNSSNTYAIIGDTAAAALYAKRLLANQVTSQISIISEGIDRTTIASLPDVSFSADNNLRVLHYLNTEQIHLVPSGNTQDGSQIERIIHYHTGSGVLGDFISSYHIPRLGPWFTHSSNSRLERFFIESTVKSALTPQEVIIASRLQAIWGLQSTSSIIVDYPSILNAHYEFINENNNSFTRELFLHQYHLVNQAENVDFISEANNLQFTLVTGTTGGNVYDITGNDINLKAVRPIWKTNPFTYLRLATEGGLNPNPVLIPTFYRAVLSIPISGTGATGVTGTFATGHTGYISFSTTNSNSNSTGTECFPGLTGITGIDLSNASATEDLITSHITFSLHDVSNPRNSGLAWLVQAYTTSEDLSIVTQEGNYADTEKTLLIIEALSTKNKRRAHYNTAEKEVELNYNDHLIEQGYLRQFALIVASIYNAYTGSIISPDTLLNDSSVCISGTCHDSNILVDYSLRESPMVSIVQLASNMYGVDIYPSKS